MYPIFCPSAMLNFPAHIKVKKANRLTIGREGPEAE